MNELHTQQCEACRADSPKVSDEEQASLLPKIPDWQAITDVNMLKLQRVFTFSNFVEAMDFSQKVGELAEQFGHYPAILTEWGKVTISWWTHKIKGLHKTDFIMAAKTDKI